MSDRLQVLLAIYQSDRADRSSLLTVSLASMGAAVTYLIGTVAFYQDLDRLGWMISLLPFPLVCVAAFHVQLAGLAAVRARSILILERALLDAVQTPGVPRLDPAALGATAGERHANLHTATPAGRAAILISYGGVGLVNLGYITVMLIRAAEHMAAWIALPALCYTALVIPIALAWRHTVASLDFRSLPRP